MTIDRFSNIGFTCGVSSHGFSRRASHRTLLTFHAVYSPAVDKPARRWNLGDDLHVVATQQADRRANSDPARNEAAKRSDSIQCLANLYFLEWTGTFS